MVVTHVRVNLRGSPCPLSPEMLRTVKLSVHYKITVQLNIKGLVMIKLFKFYTYDQVKINKKELHT